MLLELCLLLLILFQGEKGERGPPGHVSGLSPALLTFAYMIFFLFEFLTF